MPTVHIGNGAGFSGDRFDASLPVIQALSQKQGPKYLTFEVLAERTIATAQRIRQQDPSLGFSPYLSHYMGPAASGAGMDDEPCSDIPNASAMAVMVEAVPMVMQ